MDIKTTTPLDLFPSFLMESMGLLDILVKGALTLANAGGEGNGPARSCIYANADYTLLYLHHFSL